MNSQIYVNFPVKDLQASMAFFAALGYTFNQKFTNESGACMVVSDNIYVMLVTHEKFRGFIPSNISDAKKNTEVLLCLNCDSRKEVDAIIEKAVAAGATTYSDPIDFSFMYFRSFQDLDGHIWEYMWMDPAYEPGQC